jgi:DNA-damage-inducible protein J
MANMSNAINMSFRVDKNLKAQADELFKNLGMNTSVALNMFLTQSVREQALPFTPNMISPEPSNELKEALQELDDIEKGKIKVKGYHNINTFIDDMLK